MSHPLNQILDSVLKHLPRIQIERLQHLSR